MQKIPDRRKRPLFLLLLALTGALMAVLNWTLHGERYGIIALEKAGSEEKARQIIAAWDASEARSRALFNVHLDFLFLVVYSTTVALACILASGMFRTPARWESTVGVALAWGQWLAALLDAVENVALLKMLRGPVTEPWPWIARWSAIPKFILIGAGVAYAVVGACICIAARNERT